MKERTTAFGVPTRDAAEAASSSSWRSGIPTALLDTVLVVVAIAALPLWIALLLGYAALILARQLYWWARGNTTATSRVRDSIAPAQVVPAAERADDSRQGAPVGAASAWSPTTEASRP